MKNTETSAQVITLVEAVYSLLDKIVALELNEANSDDLSTSASATPTNNTAPPPPSTTATPPPSTAPPNPRRRLQAPNSRFPAFEFGDRVLVLSSDKHFHKKATITGIYGEQFWWLRTDSGESFRKKYSSLRKLE